MKYKANELNNGHRAYALYGRFLVGPYSCDSSVMM